MKRAVLIVNPFATRGHRGAASRAVEARAGARPRSRRCSTERPGHATELAPRRPRDGCDAIFVFSGDGGFNEALNGADGDVPLGFIPGGGTSVLPRALGLPRDPVAAARGSRMRSSRPHAADLARPRQRPALRVQRRARLRRGGRAAHRRARARRATAGGPATSRSRRRRPACSPSTAAASSPRSSSRASAARRSRSSPTATPYTYAGRVPLPSRPRRASSSGLDFVAPRRVRRRSRVPRLSRASLTRPRRRAARVLYGHDLDRIEVVLRPAAAAAGRRRGPRRRDRGRLRGRARRGRRARLAHYAPPMAAGSARGARAPPRDRTARYRARSTGSTSRTCSSSTARWCCCGRTTSARSSTTARAHRHLRDLLEPRGDAGRLGVRARGRATGSSRAIASRRSDCCAACRPRRSSVVARPPGRLVEPADYNLASICVPIATHVPHAAGLAWGKKLKGESACAIAYFGDGATSEGAFHEGANFAGVMRAPLDPLLQQQPVGDLDAALRADARRDARRQGGRLRHSGRARRRRRRARGLRGDARGGRAGPRGRRTDVHRGGHLPRGAARDRRRPVARTSTSSASRRNAQNECLGRLEAYLRRHGVLTRLAGGRRARGAAARAHRVRRPSRSPRRSPVRARVRDSARVSHTISPSSAASSAMVLAQLPMIEAINDASTSSSSATTPCWSWAKTSGGRGRLPRDSHVRTHGHPLYQSVTRDRYCVRAKRISPSQPLRPQPAREHQQRVVAQLEGHDRPDAGAPHGVANARPARRRRGRSASRAAGACRRGPRPPPARRADGSASRSTRCRRRRREHVLVAGRDPRVGQRDAVLGQVRAGAVCVPRAQPGDGGARIAQKRRDVLRRAPADAADGDAQFSDPARHSRLPVA